KSNHRIASVINPIFGPVFESGKYFLFFPDVACSRPAFEEAESTPDPAQTPSASRCLRMTAPTRFPFPELVGNGKEQGTESTNLGLFAWCWSNVRNFMLHYSDEGSIFFQ